MNPLLRSSPQHSSHTFFLHYTKHVISNPMQATVLLFSQKHPTLSRHVPCSPCAQKINVDIPHASEILIFEIRPSFAHMKSFESAESIRACYAGSFSKSRPSFVYVWRCPFEQKDDVEMMCGARIWGPEERQASRHENFSKWHSCKYILGWGPPKNIQGKVYEASQPHARKAFRETHRA
jgi:hypothetical protein